MFLQIIYIYICIVYTCSVYFATFLLVVCHDGVVFSLHFWYMFDTVVVHVFHIFGTCFAIDPIDPHNHQHPTGELGWPPPIPPAPPTGAEYTPVGAGDWVSPGLWPLPMYIFCVHISMYALSGMAWNGPGKHKLT